MNYIVKLENVSVKYKVGKGSYLTAVDKVNLSIPPGSIVGIVGRSGCGKTTLLKVIAGLIKPSEGKVDYNKEYIVGEKPRIGMMFQSPLLLPWRNILENILLPLEIMGEDPEEYVERALSLIKSAGLRGFESRYPWELSGGMQQRAALCRALIHKPQLLLLDEPFGALDALTREEMWILLDKIYQQERTTIVFVTHDIREAIFLSDIVVVMTERPGRVKAEVKIEFPRPRSLELQYSPEFNELVARIRGLLG